MEDIERSAPKTWFTADTHFGHGGALGLFRRPFDSVADMDRAMIDHWNAVVAPDDIVWHLGDFGYRLKEDRTHALLAALNGRKRLVTGNNDDAATRAADGWDSVEPYVEITLDGVPLVLCHYPFRSWRDMRKGAWNLHGHSHGALEPVLRQADVGVDVWSFRPVSLADIMAQRKRGARRVNARTAPER